MATKKCPKCGEENPAEAVMCWACYTPLAGGAAAATAGGLVTPRGGTATAAPAGVVALGDEEKKQIDPKIFLVVGLLVVAGVIGAFTTGVFGGGGGDTLPDVTSDLPTNTRPAPGGGGAPVPPPASPRSGTVGGGTTGGGTTGGTTPAAVPFTTIVPPNPKYADGTMAILVAPNTPPGEALGMAKYAKQLFAPGGRWNHLQVLVFNNAAAAKAFQKYQARNQDAALGAQEYQELSGTGIWANVPAYLETRGKTENVFRPSTSPNSWWSRAGR